MAKREAVFPASRQALYEKHGYSAAIKSGDLLFVSGQVGSREDGSPEPEFVTQVGDWKKPGESLKTRTVA